MQNDVRVTRALNFRTYYSVLGVKLAQLYKVYTEPGTRQASASEMTHIVSSGALNSTHSPNTASVVM